MAWFKRIFLFMAVNLLILVTLSFTLNLLGVQPYLTQYGIDYYALMMFCLVWGMGGAVISLGLSRIMAKWMMGVRVIDPAQARGDAAELVAMVHRLAAAAGLEVLVQRYFMFLLSPAMWLTRRCGPRSQPDPVT